MIDIYVYGENEQQRNEIAEYIQTAVLIQEYNMRLRLETSIPEEMLEAAKAAENIGFYFFDTDLSCTKSLMIARKIRDYDPRAFIVVTTANSDAPGLSFQFKVEAVDVIIKVDAQQIRNRICECMDDVAKKYSRFRLREQKSIAVTSNRQTVILESDKIQFFETSPNGHRIVVHMEDGKIEFYGKMKEIQGRAGEAFLRCHRAYLVNKNNIKEVNYEESRIVMRTQESCPISRRMLGKVKKIMEQM